MTLFAQFTPEGEKGLTIAIHSAEAEPFIQAVKALEKNPKLKPEKLGYTQRFIDGFRQADLFLDGWSRLKYDDEIQYDAETNMLLAVGLALEDGREIPVNFDRLTSRLAEHVYMSYHEAKKASLNNTKATASHGSTKGKDIDCSLLTMSNMLMVALFLRYSMTALQLFLRKRLKVLIPILIGKGKKGNVMAVANGTLLDPEKNQEFLAEQLELLLDNLVVKSP